MMKQVSLTVAALCCAMVLCAGEFKNDGLLSGIAEEYFQPAKGILTEASRLTLPSGALRQVTTLPWKARPFERIVLSFRAKVEGPHVIEDNPQYGSLFFKGEWAKAHAGQPLASWRVRCLDKDGKEVRQSKNFDQFFTTLMRREMRDYKEEFITPPGTESIIVVFKNANKEDSVVIENLLFEQVSNPATKNVNPDFALGLENFSGWNCVKNCKIIENPDLPGGFLFQAGNAVEGGSFRSDWIPVTPGEKLQLEYKIRKTEGVKGGARLIVFTYKDNLLRDDCQTGSLKREFYFGPKVSEGKYPFVVPEGINVLRFYGDNLTIEYAKIVPFTDEAK